MADGELTILFVGMVIIIVSYFSFVFGEIVGCSKGFEETKRTFADDGELLPKPPKGE
jgi:hypothetical protein